MRLFKSLDVRAVGLLFILWLLFFWRILTPIDADKASFKQGDFSGQFVAFGAYQYQRMSQGEIPLWNPYNNGGFPFIADTQAAVFYPPRLLTIALAKFAGGWSYNALQLEAIFHVLAYSLLMYLFIRRLTLTHSGSHYGAFIGAVVAAYSGFLSGYPPLQLAILEAAIWLPLSALGILEATRYKAFGWRWITLAGFALGISWMAGHPQTSWFLTYLMLAWLGYRVYVQKYGWTTFIAASVLMGLVTIGTTAVTLLPGIEYLRLTARTGMGFVDKGNGFPFQDLAQFILPGSVSQFSPLYVGIPALIFAYIAIRDRLPNSFFWFVVAIVGLLHSFGEKSAFYHLLYYPTPGLVFFRGQERAVFLVANSLAILAGIGAAQITLGAYVNKRNHILRILLGLIAILSLIAIDIFVQWQLNLGENSYPITGITFFSLIVTLILYGLLRWQLQAPHRLALVLIAVLVIFELFTVNMDADHTYDDVPASQQLSMTPLPIIQALLADAPEQPYRVDGFRGIHANYGSLYQVMDIRGISPLFLSNAQAIIYRDYINNPLAWELFAVRYVFSPQDSFGSMVTTVIAEGNDRDGHIFLHELDNPRPFAQLIYYADIVDNDADVFALLNTPNYPLRESVILAQTPDIELPQQAPENFSAIVTDYQPESFTVLVITPENAILSLAHVDYPGWQTTLDGEQVDIMRANGVLTAIAIPAGEHTVRLTYEPLSYRLGAILSLVTWGLLTLFLGAVGYKAIMNKQQENS
jgi:hypothetical protein